MALHNFAAISDVVEFPSSVASTLDPHMSDLPEHNLRSAKYIRSSENGFQDVALELFDLALLLKLWALI